MSATTGRKKSINQQNQQTGQENGQIEQPTISKSQINRSPLQTQSVYQRCLLLRSRLLRVEGFNGFLDSVHSTNCVNLLWECFKLGNSLCHLFNQLGLEQQLEVSDNYDINKQSICKKGVARFIISCKLLGDTSTGWTSDDLFTVTDLYKQDTSGFIRVLHTVNLVVNEVDKRGKLMEVTPTETDDAPILESTNQSRVKITQELIESERKFIMDMELLQSFSNEIRNSNIFSHDTHHSIFTNLNALVDFQRRVQISLEEAFEVDQSGGIGLWGKAFTDHVSSGLKISNSIIKPTQEQDWLVYAPFVINYNHANNIVLEQADAIQNGTPSGLSHYEVQALLIKPTQRVCKYHMFLDVSFSIDVLLTSSSYLRK